MFDKLDDLLIRFEEVPDFKEKKVKIYRINSVMKAGKWYIRRKKYEGKDEKDTVYVSICNSFIEHMCNFSICVA